MLVFGLIQDDSTLQRDWFHFSSTTKTVVQIFRRSNYKFLCKTERRIQSCSYLRSSSAFHKTVVQIFRRSNYKILCKTQDPILLNAIDSTFPLQMLTSWS